MVFDIQKFDTTKFDSILSRGLSHGLGKRGQQVCIEAAICETLGLPHSDDPKCVTEAVRTFKIALNDSKWSSPQARAQGLRDLGIAQLGSLGVVSDKDFATKLSEKVIRVLIPKLYRELYAGNKALQAAADRCEREGTADAAYAAADAAYAAYAAAADADAAAARAAAYAAEAAADAAYSDAARAAAADAARAARAAAYAAADADAAYAAYAADAADARAAAYSDAARAAAADAARAARAAAYAAADADAAYAAYAADAADAAADADTYLLLAAQCALDLLRELNSPGVALLEK